jgi:hypothetical protein
MSQRHKALSLEKMGKCECSTIMGRSPGKIKVDLRAQMGRQGILHEVFQLPVWAIQLREGLRMHLHRA